MGIITLMIHDRRPVYPVNLYDTLQLDPAVLKQRIAHAENTRERRRYQAAMVIRSLLLVLFAIVFIAPLNALFGSENSAMAVAIFCILLAVRFVDFNCRVQDALINLAIVFLLLCFAPMLAERLPLAAGIGVHFAALLLILIMTCDRPEMGNGGLYGFAYVFLAGNPVSGTALWARFLMTCLGFAICGAIYFAKHHGKHHKVHFSDQWRHFDLRAHKHQWQVRMALGISLILAIGAAVHLDRFMWAGFAVSSILADHRENADIQEKSTHRLSGVLAGSLLFYLVYSLLPPSLYTLLGPLGGFCLGFCTDYRSKTALNCFGALILAASIYGLDPSVMLRLFDTLIGVLFALVFYVLFNRTAARVWPGRS